MVISLVLPLVAGQEVQVEPADMSQMFGAAVSGGMSSWFSALLIHAN